MLQPRRRALEEGKSSFPQRQELWLDAILRSRAQEMQVIPLPLIGLLMKVLDLSGSSILHHCPQTPRHGEDLRRALAEEQVQEQLEPKAPEPEEVRAHTAVQTELCSDEPGDHGIKVEMVCQADVHLEQPPALLCSLAEEGGAMAWQAKGGGAKPGSQTL
ncbi:radial spoke head protein 3 homolog B-like [Athene cunicularia]|uniref:radial spoke head protein 3 homolog B-like n=1 Tax=Athene cunicularia TaxID=194338 RepID=UPI000EF700E5|nr:radial spoke head protein 3 homolog B-like [Athene cunicularia]